MHTHVACDPIQDKTRFRVSKGEFFGLGFLCCFSRNPNRFIASGLAEEPSVLHRRRLSKSASNKEAALLRYTLESASTKARRPWNDGKAESG